MSMLSARHLLGISAVALLTSVGSAFADDVAWPSDFWTVFSNRVTSARSADTAVAEQYPVAVVPAWVAAVEGGLGTASVPFDSMDRFWFVVDVAFFNSKKPKGIFVNFK